MVTKLFTDFDLSFTPNPGSGDIFTKRDVSSIKQSLRNLILTNHYERPFHPEIGCQVKALLFELFHPATKAAIEKAITDTIENFEPRVSLISVQVTDKSDLNAVDIRLEYSILNTQKIETLQMSLVRTR